MSTRPLIALLRAEVRAPSACGAALLLALCASAASAHLGHTILRAERYLKIDASDADTRVVVSLTLGDVEGLRALRAADGDADAVVSAEESERYLAEWASGLADELPIFVDGERVPVQWTDGYLDPIGPVRQASLTIEMVAHVPTAGREHLVVVEDRMVRREIFDRTDVAFRAHDGAELASCGLDREDGHACEPDVSAVRGGPQPERLVARVRYPRREERAPWTPAIVIAGSILLVTAVALVVRRLRK